MPTPNYHLEHNQTGSGHNPRAEFPGKYISARTWSGGQLDLSGSDYGYGAFLRSGSVTNGEITVAGGAAIAINNFEENRLFEIGVTKISGSLAPGGEIYIFKQNL